MTFGSLFFGIGGFDLGFKWAGMRCIWQSEIDPYAVKIAEKRYPGVRQLGDITKINWHKVERPDVVCGGFPCQNISQAGLKEGITGSKSRLWFEFLRCLCILRPENVVVENVSALLVRGLDTVLRGLAGIGYDAEWGVLSSAGVGKNHQRKRVFVYAYPNSGESSKEWFTLGRSGRLTSAFDASKAYVVSRNQTTQEPGIPRVANGIPNQVDRLKCLGNSIDPHVAYRVAKAIMHANPLIPERHAMSDRAETSNRSER